jgi:adenosylmethionine-8-amino-7-oxononanoate aminotransferase
MGQNSRLLTANLASDNPVAVRGHGVYLEFADGRTVLDGIAGVGVSCLGYTCPEVVQAMTAQAERLPYAHALRFDTEPLLELSAAVADVLPEAVRHCYFVSGGSEAVETAVKYARQYWLERGRPGKWKAVGLWPSFHGNTILGQSIGWHQVRRSRHLPLLTEFPHVEAPDLAHGCGHCRTRDSCDLGCADELERALIREDPETVACFMAEPIGGAATGAQVPHPDYFRRVRDICDRHDVLLVADEVFTGFGRTGTWFAMEQFGVDPDVLIFGKGIGGGFAPLAGIGVSERSIAAFRAGSGRFEHNFTYAGHAVACAAGLAVLSQLRSRRLVDRVAALEPRLFTALAEVKDSPLVTDVRGRGFLAAVELDNAAPHQAAAHPDPTTRPAPTARPTPTLAHLVSNAALNEGLLVYPCPPSLPGRGSHLLLAPAFVMPEELLDELGRRLRRALDRVESGDTGP